ncbi:TRAP transporter small permease (plasmid) [Paroceanicella profunda]|uniref:TRAP transporter small permease protein n=1 Tax=Paroceanicella profunda TaxID=2579971 RepID=A0A5B8FJ79_9RHOB|nr:TRAP transporter small permease [Paroceanicella profunda]QDL94611.1 TRAP transporter small permease [Paroceanicella profunda]
MTASRSSAAPSVPARLAAGFWSIVETVTIVSFFAMLAIMFVQVMSRYALGIGVPWTDEASRFLYIAEIFLGAAVAQRYGAQIRITVLLDMLPPRTARVLEAASDVITLVICGAVIVGAWGMMQRTANVAASTLPIPFAWLYFVQGLGIVLLALLVLRDLAVKLGLAAPSTRSLSE